MKTYPNSFWTREARKRMEKFKKEWKLSKEKNKSTSIKIPENMSFPGC